MGRGADAATQRGAAREHLVVVAYVAAVLAVGLLFARNRPDSYDADIMQQVTRGMVESWDFRTTNDVFGLNTPYSSYGLAMSLLMAPAYGYARLVGADATAAMAKTNVLLFAALALVQYRLCRTAGCAQRRSVLLSALVLLGTITFSYVSTGFSELGTACCIAGCLLALADLRLGRRHAAVFAGAWAGGALLFRTDSLVLVVAVVGAGVLIMSPRVRTGCEYAVGVLPAVVIWSAYNNLRFGAPWRLGYSGQRFDSPFLRGAYGLLASPGRGLFVYVPSAVLVLLLARPCVRRFGVPFVIGAMMLMARLLFYSTWSSWNGGVAYGPRFLVPALPVLMFPAILCAERWRSWRIPVRCSIIGLWAVGAYVAFVGAATDYLEQWYRVVNPAGLPARSADLILFHWENFPVFDQTRMLLNQDHLASPYWDGAGYLTRVLPLCLVILTSMTAVIRLTSSTRVEGMDRGITVAAATASRSEE